MSGPEKSFRRDRWDALVKYDHEIAQAAEQLRPFGDALIDEFGQAFFALNEDRAYLANIVKGLLAQAKRDEERRWNEMWKEHSKESHLQRNR
jgi:hypothetical protein